MSTQTQAEIKIHPFWWIILLFIFGISHRMPNPTLWLCLGIICSSQITTERFAGRNAVARHALHFSILLMGFGIPIAKVISVGLHSFPITFLTVTASMSLGVLISRALRLNPETGLLLTVGTTICGGSAIAAVSGAIDANPKSIAKSTLIVFVLNAIALVLFPPLGKWLHMNPHQFGNWSALAIHDTSSVVGAASVFGQEALQTAILMKLTRSLWIIPVTLIASITRNRSLRGFHIPWFIFGFILSAGLAACFPHISGIWHLLSSCGQPLFAVSMFLIGTQINLNDLRKSATRDWTMAVVMWLIVASVSAGMISRLPL